MIGSIWGHILGFSHWKYCTTCFHMDSIDHILTCCPINTREIVWNLAEQVWPHNHEQWPEINFGIILGIGCINIPTQSAHPNPQLQKTLTKLQGAFRLLQILILKAAHLVWVMRCERVIQNRQHTDSEAKKWWSRAINTRLTHDRIVVAKIKRDKKYTNLVKQTWGPVLHKDSNILYRSEVLVGSGMWSEQAHRLSPTLPPY
jgi:hypothetical protein